MLGRRNELIELFEYLMAFIIGDIHEPFDAIMVFSEEQRAIEEKLQQMYRERKPLHEIKESVQMNLDLLEKDNPKLVSWSLYLNRWLQVLQCHEQFSAMLPDAYTLEFADNHFVETISNQLAQIIEQTTNAENMSKLTRLGKHNATVELLVPQIMKLMEPQVIPSFVLDAESLAEKSIPTLLFKLLEYHKHCADITLTPLVEYLDIFEKIPQTKKNMLELLSLQQDEVLRVYINSALKNMDQLLLPELEDLAKIQNQLTEAMQKFTRDNGQYVSVLAHGKEAFTLNLLEILSYKEAEIFGYAADIFAKITEKMGEIVDLQADRIVQLDSLKQMVEECSLRINACRANSQKVASRIQSQQSSAVAIIPDVEVIEDHLSRCQSEYRQQSQSLGSLLVSFKRLGWKISELREKESDSNNKKTDANAVDCCLALANFVNTLVTFNKGLTGQAATNVSDVDELQALSSTLMAKVSGPVKSLVKILGLIIENEPLLPKLMASEAGQELLSAIVVLHARYNFWNQERKRALYHPGFDFVSFFPGRTYLIPGASDQNNPPVSPKNT